MVKYATTLQLAAILGCKTDVPSWDVGDTPSNEEVGTGDGVELIFYLDHKNVLTGSYTLYYGASASTTTTLTETTHYALDKDTGKITLTTAGRTLLSTDNIYAAYSYTGIDVPDSYLTDVIARAENRVDKKLNTEFSDGTTSNPTYPSEIEIQDSKGKWDRNYFGLKKPSIDVVSTLASDITSSDNTLDVATGDGVNYPSTGIVLLGSEIITYTGVSTDTLTGLTRGTYGSTAAAHTEADSIHTVAMQTSATGSGNEVAWNTLQWDSEFFVEVDISRFHIFNTTILAGVFIDNAVHEAQDIPNRTRLFYSYGWDSIPVDITRLTLIFAKLMLARDTVTASIFKGRNEFRPSMLEMDNTEMESIITSYKIIYCENT